MPDPKPSGTLLSITQMIAALAAQHVSDLVVSGLDCECPRCCLACRAVLDVLCTGHVFDWAEVLYGLGVEGFLWQTPACGFDAEVIEQAWHNPCPAYAIIEQNEGADDDRRTDQNRHGEIQQEAATPALAGPETE